MDENNREIGFAGRKFIRDFPETETEELGFSTSQPISLAVHF
jgi:hypothetical protein